MSVIPLPNGGSATLRDQLVSERHNRILEAAYMAASAPMAKTQTAFLAMAGGRMGVDPAEMTDAEREEAQQIINAMTPEEQVEFGNSVSLTQAEAASMLDLQDAGIVAYLESWSLKRPLPTVADVQDLDRDLYRALATATRPLIAGAMQGHEDFSERPLGENPTVSSSSSNGAPEDTSIPIPSSDSIPESSSSGESTATESSIPA